MKKYLVHLIILIVAFNINLNAQNFKHYFNLNENQCSLFEGDTLWVGTNVGLVGWDIKNKKIFAHFHAGNSKLLENNIKSLKRSPDGTLWMTGFESVSWWDGEKWKNHQFLNQKINLFRDINSLQIGSNGDVWVGVTDCIYKYSNNEWYQIFKNSNFYGNEFLVDKFNKLWLRNPDNGNLNVFYSDTLSKFNSDSLVKRYDDIYIDSNEKLWIGVTNGFQYFNGKYWEKAISPFKVGYNYPKFIKEDLSKRVWFDTNLDIAYFENDSIYFLNILEKVRNSIGLNNLKAGYVLDIVNDKLNNWVIFSKGLYHIEKNIFFPYKEYSLSPYESRIEYIGNNDFRNNNLIIVTNRFLLSFKEGKFELISAPTDILNNKIKKKQIGNNNELWLYSWHGVTRINNTEIDTFFIGKSNTKKVTLDQKGNVYGHLFSKEGLFRISEKGDVTLYNNNNRQPKYYSDLVFVPEVNGRTWVMGYHGNFYFENDNLIEFKGNLGKGYFKGKVKRGSKYWIAKDSLYTFENGEWQNQNIGLNKRHRIKEKIFLDNEENIWTIIDVDSIIQIDNEKKITGLNLKKLLLNSDIEGMKIGKKINLIWSKKALVTIHNMKWKSYKLDNFSNFRLYEDNDGNWWYGSSIYDIIKIDENEISSFKWKNVGAPFNSCVLYEIFVDSKNNIWVLTSHGIVFSHDTKKWIFYSENNVLPSKYPTSILEDRNGSIWIGTRNGLVKYNNGDFIIFDVNSGLMSNYVKKLLVYNNKLYIFYGTGFSTLDI